MFDFIRFKNKDEYIASFKEAANYHKESLKKLQEEIETKLSWNFSKIFSSRIKLLEYNIRCNEDMSRRAIEDIEIQIKKINDMEIKIDTILKILSIEK